MASVEEIFEKVQDISTAIDISTVYRTLDLLQEFNLVISTDLGDGHQDYKLVGAEDPHLHLVCQSCGKLLAVDLEEIQPFTDYLDATYGFQAELDNVTVPGLCQECRAAQNEIPAGKQEAA